MLVVSPRYASPPAEVVGASPPYYSARAEGSAEVKRARGSGRGVPPVHQPAVAADHRDVAPVRDPAIALSARARAS